MRLGTVITLPDVALAELTASAVDFVWIDLEHGAIDRRDVPPLAIAARAGGAECFVRLVAADDPALGPVLDAGVDGVVVPRVEDAAEVEAVMDRLRYPPRGHRGIAARRASGYGLRQPAGEPRCVAQIESETGAAEAGRIAAVDGVEALVVGCADLAAETPRVREAVELIHAACEAARVEFGIAGPDDPALLGELAPVPPDLAVLGADVRIYARALSQRFEEAHVGA